jgi:hypothetical protein
MFNVTWQQTFLYHSFLKNFIYLKTLIRMTLDPENMKIEIEPGETGCFYILNQ